MPTSEADAYLIESICDGDKGAWRELIDRYEGRLLAFARRMLAQPSEAEDVVQETFLGLLRSIEKFDRSRSLETYLFAILRHKLKDHFRKAGRGQRQSLETLDLEDASEAWLTTETPSHYVADRESLESQRTALVEGLRAWVDQCCEQGRFQDLIVLEMLLVIGMRNKEVAADLDLTETAVAGIKFRVLERWRQLLAKRVRHDWAEADLASTSTVARIWREEGISCPKRSTLGRHLLGALDEDWTSFIEFHVEVTGCERCRANIDDLRSEEQRSEEQRRQLRDRLFASSVGFLSRRPG